MYDIKFFEDKNGNSDVYDYIEELSKSEIKEEVKKAQKIYLYLEMLKEYGLNLREPYAKKLDKEIWELRPMKDRILFASVQNNVLLMLWMFQKKTQKTPRREIQKAKKRLKEYKERSDKNAYMGRTS